MATYLLAWELGAGLGHLVNLRPIAEGLSARGHRVVLALRDLSRAKAIFHGENISLVQAPFKHRRTNYVAPTVSFVQLLHNVGFGETFELAALAEAWRELYRMVDPDVIVFDHSPTALLAARGFRAKRALLGTGFFCPLDEQPLACLRPWLKPDLAQLARDEQALLGRINEVLGTWNEPNLERVAHLYHPSDEHFLVTFPELDHYSARKGVRYYGAWPSGLGKSPQWPAGEGKKVYAYLKPFAALPQLLGTIQQSGCPTIIYSDGIPPEIQDRFGSPTIRFENQPLDMFQVGRECGLAILNANHGTAVALLLAGKPALHIPPYLEQTLLAKAIVRLGAGLAASPADAGQVVERFNSLLADDRCVKRAQYFAAKYANFDPQLQITEILNRLEALPSREVLASVEPFAVRHWMPRPVEPAYQERIAAGSTLATQSQSTDSGEFSTHYQQGLAHQKARRLEEAIKSFEEALLLRPRDPDVLNDLGCALWSLERFEQAAKCYTLALDGKPNSPAVHNNLGCVLRALGRHGEAIESYHRALAINANVADFHNNLGCALRANGQLDEALASYERALQLKPDFADALANRGMLHLEQDRFEEAIASHHKAIQIQPHNFKLHHNLGATFLRAGRHVAAIDAYDEALHLEPDVPEMTFNRGIARLSLGHFQQGWKDYDARLLSKVHPHEKFAQPAWDGTNAPGKTILLHTEQGLGDTIQFVRYHAFVRQRAANVIVEVQPALVPLFRQSGIENVIARGTIRPEFDFQAPLMSLPWILDTTVETIPTQIPYLEANAQLAEHWQTRLAQLPGFKVGVHWQGSKTYEGDRWRSIPLRHFEAVARVPGVHLVSLQQFDGTEQIAREAEQVPLVLFKDLNQRTGPFMDTAAIVKNLDLVITCDTALAHLAGALGVPVWVCLPQVADWRWMVDRCDSPWYPTMRLVRQKRFGDWKELFDRLAIDVARECDKTARDRDPTACYRYGLKLAKGTRKIEAVRWFRSAIARRPEFPEAHNDLGCALSALGDHAGALEHFEQATQLKPDFADAHNNLGCALRTQSKYAAAVESFQKALRIRPDFAEAVNNMGNALQDDGQLEQAIEAHRQSLALKPENAEAYNGLGAAQQRMGQRIEALASFSEALRLDPDHIEARYSRALIWLSQGELERGWPDYEARKRSIRYKARSFQKPQWDGSPLDGRTLLVYAEQGLGDTLQFFRYLPIVRQMSGTVVAEVQPALLPLLRQSGFGGLVARGEKLPQFDVHAPLLSVAGIVGTTTESIPLNGPYLSADPDRIERWRDEMASIQGFRVGINWQGSVTYKEDHVRSIPLRRFEPLARVDGVTLVSLQKNQGTEQLADVADRFSVTDLGPDRDSDGAFMDTAAIMQHLDLVVTSDTAIAHLAGALGVPVWVCLPYVADWRWLLDRDDSPWYPTMRILRQPQLGDWEGVFEEVADRLRSARASVPR